MYLNFELQIHELEGNVYQAVVADSPYPLPAEPPAHRFTPPYDDLTLRRMMLILSGERVPRGASRQQTAREFGETLFKTIMAGSVLHHYEEARQLADEQGKWLRVRLNTSRAGNLASLPWEFLRDPQEDYLALSRTTALVRYTRKLVSTTRLEAALPLRILVMISAPKDVPHVDEEAERRNLERATIRLQAEGLVEITYLEDASLRSLQRLLRQKAFHVFHYIGHSTYDPYTTSGTLLLEDPYDHEKVHLVRGEALARELHEEETLRLVVLNSCQGAQSDARDPFSGIASSLVQRGIPAVVAQQFEITDKAAVYFSEEFYRAVAEGLPIEAAVAEGRRAIISMSEGSDNIEWATPVLFLHENDSRTIFNFPAAGEPRKNLWHRLTQFEHLPHILAVLTGLVVLALVFFLSGVLGGEAKEEPIGFPPPTATTQPDVDLVITDVRLSPRNPQPGEYVAVFVDIENRGEDAAPPFTYQWQPSIFAPTTVIERQVQGLAAGGILHDNFAARFGWWGVFISETRVDPNNVIVEESEQNTRQIPVRTDGTLPFSINFNEPLPNGDFIRHNQPVPFGAFDQWGFRVDATHPDPACQDAVPWFKYTGISRIALTTGLLSDATQCTDASIIITFTEQRPDNNLSGISGLQVDFAAGTGRRVVQPFRDIGGMIPLSPVSGVDNRNQGLSLRLDQTALGFQRVFRIQIDSETNVPVNITGFTFYAP